MYYVYVIESQMNHDLYKGFTKDVNARLRQHNEGLTYATKVHRPWKLIYCEIFVDKKDAIAREKYLKSGWGRKFLGDVLKNYLENKK